MPVAPKKETLIKPKEVTTKEKYQSLLTLQLSFIILYVYSLLTNYLHVCIHRESSFKNSTHGWVKVLYARNRCRYMLPILNGKSIVSK